MKKLIPWLCLCFFLLCTFKAHAEFIPESPFQVLWDDTPQQVQPGDPFTFEVIIRIPPDHYLYADKTNLEFTSLDGVRVEEIIYPKPMLHVDSFLNRQVEIFVDEAVITVKGHVPQDHQGSSDVTAILSVQGCTPKLCLRPEEHRIMWKLELAEKGEMPAAQPPTTTEGFWELLSQQDLHRLLAAAGGMGLIGIVFLAGLLTSFTPCVWPVIPVVLLVVGVHPQQRVWRNALLSMSLVAGMVLTYALLGVLAAALGKTLGFLFQSRWFLLFTGGAFLLMALSMFGLFDLRLPRNVQHWLHQLGGKGFRGAFLAGLGVGLIASPCVGPVLAAVLASVALSGSYVTGFVLLLVYGLGMGLTFVVIATAFATLERRLPRGAWTLWTKRALGVFLIIPALFYLGSLVGWTPARILAPRTGEAIAWVHSVSEGLEQAKQEHKPVLIDFFADWCVPCQELNRGFFRRGDIVELSKQFVMVHMNATMASPDVDALMAKYRVRGFPTIVFVAPDGKTYDDLTVPEADEWRIERSMQEALKRSRK